jgi:peptidoglycan/LPS O-acetylase OafA/YrhL
VATSVAHNYRNLDLLRTLAVLWVFICHISLMFPLGPTTIRLGNGLGRFGVILFFFHTSFVLMQSLDALEPYSVKWVLKFYVRRLFRIYPLAILLIGLAVVAGVPFAPWDLTWSPARSFLTVPANLLLIQNLIGQPSVIAPLWSLPIEIQMYALLPLVYRVFDHEQWRLRLGLCLGAAGATAFVVFELTHHLNTLAFVPCFFSGSLAHKLMQQRKPNWDASGWFLTILAVTALGVLFSLKIPAEWLLCFILAVAFPRFLDMRPNWSSRMCQLIARYSYGIYLTHLFAIWIAFILMRNRLDSPTIRVLVTVVITGLASVAFFHVLENPLIRLGKRIAFQLDERAAKLGSLLPSHDRQGVGAVGSTEATSQWRW